MSVRCGDRKIGEIQIVNKMKILTEHTMSLYKNPKNFPSPWKDTIGKDIVDENLIAFRCIHNIYKAPRKIKTPEYKKKKLLHALTHLKTMLSLLELARAYTPLNTKQITYWSSLIVGVIELIKM